ncbi:MAG TPA: shikimate kinase [Vicinamibacterales bacterium]|nr:shikimate kinase [Vicinamibacterales bacterium]
MTDRLGCRIVLVGMMGSGKSTIGSLLAQMTGWPLYDNDALLDELYGMTAMQILQSRGEEELREAEDEALELGLRRRGPSIVDAAAGTIMSEGARSLLQRVPVVWLRARPETLYARAASAGGKHRPWLAGGEEWMRATAGERAPLYASVADLVVDTDDTSPKQVAGAIINRLGVLCPELATAYRGDADQ